ncbi:MAG: prolyl-tRNA editing enzyme YbaK/EbsC (Cys-tRNA(Pro) deacylase) [Verrucomicrobiales bacterium]|jgi:prolyl-tRNA editing enzyme YbaK/EbsC (Cys-tRNA(Pro) deacylase)
MRELPSSAQAVVDAARDHGLVLDVVEYPDGARTAVDAANAVGCDVGQIVKSLIFSIDGELVLALTSGANRVDTGALVAAAGGERCDRADADQVRATTGFAIGGVPPFGHANPVRAFFDPALSEYEVVWAAAGTPRHVFPIDPSDLLHATQATLVDFCE